MVETCTATLTLTGACLDQLNSVSLAPQVTGDATVKGGVLTFGTEGKNTTATSAFALQTESDKTGLKPDSNYYLTYATKVQPNVDVKNETLKVKVPQSAGSAGSNQGAPTGKPQASKPTTGVQSPGGGSKIKPVKKPSPTNQ